MWVVAGVAVLSLGPQRSLPFRSSDEDLKEVREGAMWLNGDIVFQAEGTPNSTALKEDHPW